MDNYIFTLRNDVSDIQGEKIGKFDAFFPETDKNSKAVQKDAIPKYVSIKDCCFKVKFYRGNNAIFISPDVLAPIDKKNNDEAIYSKVSYTKYFFYKINKDKTQKWMFWSLVAASIGVLIDSSFAIGKIHTFFICSPNAIIILLSLAMLLKIFGLLVAFLKGFWDSK